MKKLTKILSIFIVSIFVLSSFAGIINAVDLVDEVELSESETDDGLIYDAKGYGPIPLLVIKINFDANGNGKNDYDSNDPTKLYGDKTSEFYGEQYCYTNDEVWADELFATDHKSLYTYYRVVTNNKFWFYAANETSGKENDGIVTVTINQRHPDAIYGHNEKSKTSWSNERSLALRAAAQYVDFKSFDKNGNGSVEKDELAVVFIVGGAESSTYKGDSKSYWYNHAHYTSGSGITIDGVKVQQGTGFVRIGEMSGAAQQSTFGVFAHELGHYLGAIDLYDTSYGKFSDVVGNLSLMASGSHGYVSGDAAHGMTPSFMDPYHLVSLGYMGYTTATSGQYTLYSRQSTAGKYNIIRINTPNPNEYYLIENRYCETSSTIMTCDNTTYSAKGIVVWHVDESRAFGNNSSKTEEPRVVVLNNSSIGGTGNVAFKNGDNVNESAKHFVNTRYKFYSTKTWSTLLTAKEMEEFGFTFDVDSDAGNEMKITIHTSWESGPYLQNSVAEKDLNYFTLVSKIKTLNNAELTDCGFAISTKADFTLETADKVVHTTLDPKTNSFKYTFDGLSEGKKYYYIIFATTEKGTSTYTGSVTTLVTPMVRDYATVYLCQNISARGGFYSVKLYPGNTLTYQLQMKKTGYQFGGWYYDEDFSGERYDMAEVKQDKIAMYLYAKWIPNNEACTLTIVGGESKYVVYATEVGDTFMEPTLKEREGYEFAGWFVDENLLEPFDFGKVIEETGETKVYVKWNKVGGGDEPEITTTVNPPVVTTGSSTTTTVQEPVTTTPSTTTSEEAGDNSSSSIIIPIVIVVAAVIVCGVVVFIVIKKKKNK